MRQAAVRFPCSGNERQHFIGGKSERHRSAKANRKESQPKFCYEKIRALAHMVGTEITIKNVPRTGKFFPVQ
jgi:hypothetical protein